MSNDGGVDPVTVSDGFLSGRFGADEAGKGPVLGSMFAAAVAAPSPAVLPDGVDDSKRLTAKRRRELDAALRATDDVAIGLVEVPVDRIDDPVTDMNALTLAAQANAIQRVAVDGMTGVVDAADVDAARFGRRLESMLTADVTVDARHGADETDLFVGAASVVAKVARDAHVDALAAEHGDVGSGYASDDTTRAFLADYVDAHGALPGFARASWKTSRDVLAAHAQQSLTDF